MMVRWLDCLMANLPAIKPSGNQAIISIKLINNFYSIYNES